MSAEEMVVIPAGRYRMGSADFYPEEAPVREIDVGSFAIQRTPVTVTQFARFVDETGYVTSPSGHRIPPSTPRPTLRY